MTPDSPALGGALTISGCNLRLVGRQLVGSLADGSLVFDCRTTNVTSANLSNQSMGPVQINCPQSRIVSADAGKCTASLNPGTATASDGCSTAPLIVGVRSDSKSLTAPYPMGTTTINWTATNGVGDTASCSQTITV
jgi:hypothetical protein